MTNRNLTVAVLVTGLSLTGAGTVLAAGLTSKPTGVVEGRAAGEIPKLTSGGVAFQGRYRFEPPCGAADGPRGCPNRGAFHFSGKLEDTAPGDGHNVYVQVRVEGHRNWMRFDGRQKDTVELNWLVYDGSELATRDAWIRVCRDKGSFNPDNCSKARHYSRR